MPAKLADGLGMRDFPRGRPQLAPKFGSSAPDSSGLGRLKEEQYDYKEICQAVD